jgi:hypothetical protein
MVTAKWTGSYPCLCHGEWKLYINGQDYSHIIPEEKRHSDMGTAGTYQEWWFEDWIETFGTYEDGMEYEEWMGENEWVLDLPAAPFDVFLAFQAEDWRSGSCGGCI